jgi:undecaprenyl-diphosphatase
MLSLFQSFIIELQNFSGLVYWFMLLVSFLESFAFVGLVIPGSSLIVFAGVLASQKIIKLGSLIVAVAVGGILGDAASFYLGKRGVKLFSLNNKIFKTEYLKKGEDFFLKHGNRSVIFARFFGPIRPVVPFVAGMFKMPSRKFFLYNVISACISAPLYVCLGYFLGGASGQAERVIGRVGILLLIIFIFLAGVFYFKKNISRMGQDFFTQLSVFLKTIFKTLGQSFRRVDFVRRPHRGINFLKQRVTTKKLTGLPLSVFLVLIIITMLFWVGILKEIIISPSVIRVDADISEALVGAREKNVVIFFRTVSYLGSVFVLPFVVLVSSVLLWIKKKYQFIVPYIFCSVFGTGMILFLKSITGRPRPSIAPVYQERLFSFPSLHSFGAVLIYGFLAYVFISLTKKWQQKINVAFWVFLLILLIGFSRIYLGVHFFSDVIAGYILGILWLAIGINTTHIFKKQ